MYHTFIGIDISKNDFYVAIHGVKDTQCIDNNLNGFNQFYKTYKKQLSQTLVVLETTGGYEHSLVEFLQSKKIAVHRANTRIVKSFIRSTGKLGKSDKIDAIGLARYGSERYADLELYQPPSDIEKELLQLTNRKIDLKRMLVQEKNRYQSPDNYFIKANCKSLIDSLDESIKKIKQRITELINADKKIKDKVSLLKNEVSGIGEATAIDLLSTMPELGRVSSKAIASLSGTAPHPYESGKKIGYRSTRGGRQMVKPILYMAAMAAAKSKDGLGEFYRALIARGKKPMVALTALMRKIIVIVNAKIRDFEQHCKMQVTA